MAVYTRTHDMPHRRTDSSINLLNHKFGLDIGYTSTGDVGDGCCLVSTRFVGFLGW